TITNFGKEVEWVSIEDNPEDENTTHRKVPFSKEIYIEQEDFLENPPKKFFRLFPGGKVRLKGAYIIECNEVVKDINGNIIELKCSYIPESKSGNDTSGIHVKGTLHWVSVEHAVHAEVKLYDRLFHVENVAEAEGDFKEHINPNSLQVLDKVYAEPALLDTNSNNRYQFLRKGYFCLDKDSSSEKLVFNRTVTLKDTWAKEVKK
ncbi:MAG: glutamine--tRNA ligase, partial [Chitinophagaceae bacterium]|nr:glutamine--tRNA ligase [Chitinophagaceae bacterium]